ncbi:hypothetical protein ETAA8_13150 [Anatilimnocola aggregata]|uniref:DUF1552 domain-containing protein n=1 Tax=Anatilimnocola aggregata TaxID=2528021 RepID=A0A517Y7N0_9BACT|nr:DUF1552 domain-containing protein [Anatilimnocola aggregata]QDU26239.1 hypothetical protein ETAA8_13150 [Anatilimnocola aggregata]
MTHIALTAINRRTFLRASGAALALPLLDAMRPAFGQTAEAPRRMLCICTNLGVLERHFFPAEIGRGYALTPYLEAIKDHRDQFTVVSGSSHGEVTGGHSAEVTFLTAAPHPGTASFRNSISLDQFAAERIGHLTRVSALPLVVSKAGNQSLSFTSSGVMLPAERSPAQVFKALFVAGDAAAVQKQVEQLRTGRSILDAVADRAAALQKQVGSSDRERLDQYFTSVREVERRLLIAEEWERKPKPKVDAPPLKDGEYLLEKLGAMYDLAHLAFATDSTRLATLFIKLDGFSEHIPGVGSESHNLSHHVGREDKLRELKNLELAEFQQLNALLTKLHSSQEGGSTLLERTQVLYGSNLGNGNNHDTKNLPILLAGGGFKHGQHLAFDKTNNEPLPNLFVSMLQRLGIETDKFASSKGTLKGLKMA